MQYRKICKSFISTFSEKMQCIRNFRHDLKFRFYFSSKRQSEKSVSVCHGQRFLKNRRKINFSAVVRIIKCVVSRISEKRSNREVYLCLYSAKAVLSLSETVLSAIGGCSVEQGLFFCAEYGAGSVFALRDCAVTRCTAKSHACATAV